MAEALLLRYGLEFPGVVALAPVADQDTAKIGRNQFPYFLVAVLPADLKDL